MQAPRNYGATREAPGPSRVQLPVIPAVSLDEEQESDPVLNDDDYFGIESFRTRQPEELIQVSYKQLVRNYSLVPICSFLFLILMAIIPRFWETSVHKDRLFPLLSLGVAFSAWVVSYGFKAPSHTLATGFGRWVTNMSVILGVLISTFLQEMVRLSGFVILSLIVTSHGHHRHHLTPLNTASPAFLRVWWYALGWATGVELYGIAHGYFQLAVYKDVLEDDAFMYEESDLADEALTARSEGRRYISSMLKSPEERVPEENTRPMLTRLSTTLPSRDAPISGYLDEEMARLLDICARAELEQVYGIPPPNIPVFISCLQRFDSILYAFGITLIISHRYLAALMLTQKRHPDDRSLPFDYAGAITATFPTFIVLLLLTTAVNTMWALALPSIGVHSASYAALLLALGLFFSGLGYWDALS